MAGLLTLTLGVFLSLTSDVSASCKAEITDPPRSPRHTLTPGQRDLVLERLKAEIPRGEYDFTDVVLHKGIVTVTLTVRDAAAGEQYPGQTCVAGGFGSVRLLVDDRDGECRLQKRFFAVVEDCLEGYESGKTLPAGKSVPISK